MAEETKTEVKEVKENKFKKLLDLEPLFTEKLAKKLKPQAKILYYVLSVVLALALLGSLFSITTDGPAVFLVKVALIMVFFVVVRMFAEYLVNKD